MDDAFSLVYGRRRFPSLAHTVHKRPHVPARLLGGVLSDLFFNFAIKTPWIYCSSRSAIDLVVFSRSLPFSVRFKRSFDRRFGGERSWLWNHWSPAFSFIDTLGAQI